MPSFFVYVKIIPFGPGRFFKQMTFLKLILGFILLYYFFVVVIRYVIPWLFRRQVKKAQERFYGQAGPDPQKKRQGEVNFDYDSSGKGRKKKDDDLGEYVDYEEIKD